MPFDPLLKLPSSVLVFARIVNRAFWRTQRTASANLCMYVRAHLTNILTLIMDDVKTGMYMCSRVPVVCSALYVPYACTWVCTMFNDKITPRALRAYY